MQRSFRSGAAVALMLLFLGSTSEATENKLDAIDLVSPVPTTVFVAGGQGSVKVFYRLKRELAKENEVAISATDAGPVPDADIKIVERTMPTDDAIRSFRILVNTTTPLKAGETHAGKLVFQHEGLVDQFVFTLAPTAPAAFTLSPDKLDVCVNCGHGQEVFPITVSNTGSSTITQLKVSTLALEDASIHVRAIYPAPQHPIAGETASSAASDQAPPSPRDGVQVLPGQVLPVTIPPGASLTIHVALDVPAKAGAYSGAIHVSANDGERKPVPLILRTRGPNVSRWLPPLLLFVATLLAGAAAAKVLEHYYGSGGGLIRARALLSMEASRSLLGDVARWIDGLPAELQGVLARTRAWVNADFAEIDTTIESYRTLKAVAVEARANDIVTRVAKRRALRALAERVGSHPDVLVRLDAVPPEGDLSAYENALRVALAPQLKQEMTPKGSRYSRIARASRWIVTVIPGFRIFVWLTATFATAYGMFYWNKCSFGTVMDYLTVFLWALGLTSTGLAVITEARSGTTPQT
jgi:hypothetical protein